MLRSQLVFKVRTGIKNQCSNEAAKAVLKWERKFDRAYRKEKGKYKNNSIFDYLIMSLKIIGDYK